VRTAAAGTDCRIAHVFDGTPAQAAGLSGNDVLVALDGLRVTPSSLDKLLTRYMPGDSIEVHAFRRDELMRFAVKLAASPPPRFLLAIDARAPAAAVRQRARWLGQD
jgi:predicted metalloprotease with PDZ domain